MNKLSKALVSVAVGVVSTISLAPLLGVAVPEGIWGMCIGALISLVSTLIPQGVEKFEYRQPANYKAKIVIEAEEK